MEKKEIYIYIYIYTTLYFNITALTTYKDSISPVIKGITEIGITVFFSIRLLVW